MRKPKLKLLFILVLLLLSEVSIAQKTKLTSNQQKAGEIEATAVINRFTGNQLKVKVKLDIQKDQNGCAVYTYSTKKDVLYIHATDAVSACRGFYDWVKQKKAGISSWSGSRFMMPADFSTEKKTITSPYSHHQYMNVVTYGYTAPYWDKSRWDKELDWMALHGIDMPLLLLAQEQVYREVFMDMGLTKEEIDEWEVGPAHLPWMRMGNLSGNSFDGPLGEDWNKNQVELCKYVIDRMRKLGMKPICPAFGGFVPKAFVNHYEGILDFTGWDWVPVDSRNYRLNPGSEAFLEVGTRFIKKWEEKFGKCQYYLSDSFNEMAIPNDTTLMTAYGDAIYKSITNANPDAVWTMQGWTLGYQRSSWMNGILEALVKNVPNDKFMALDMATDYNYCFWHAPYDWDTYDGFYGKQWVWSVIPNMGGKTAMTGYLDYYANARLQALQSDNRGNLTGYGFAPEGVENNELLYELVTDAGWANENDSIDVAEWLDRYADCRYGDKDMTKQMRTYYESLRHSVYNSFQDHPQFAWQVRNNIIGQGNINQNEVFCDGVEKLFDYVKNNTNTQSSPLLQADLIEAAALYTAGKIEIINARIAKALDENDTEEANTLLEVLKDIMLRLDRSLTAHPLYDLEKWEKQAMAVAQSDADIKRNAVNARRIVSVWYGNHEKDEPVNDYACRVWAGLIRDYYLPRLIGTWNRRINNIPFDQIEFENSFVNKAPALSYQEPLTEEQLPQFIVQMVEDANKAGKQTETIHTNYKLSTGKENHWYQICCMGNTQSVLTIMHNGEVSAQSDTKAGEQFWRFVETADASVVAENRWGKLLTMDEVKAVAGETLCLKTVPSRMIPEVISSDCERYISMLEQYDNPSNGIKGNHVSKQKLKEARAKLIQWRDNIAHESYNSFLEAWQEIYESLIVK